MKTHRARAMAMSPLLVRAVVAGRVPSGIGVESRQKVYSIVRTTSTYGLHGACRRGLALCTHTAGVVILAVVLLIMASGVHISAARAAEGSLSGMVTYPDGSAAAGVKVETFPAHSPFPQAITDPQGKWTYGPLPAGTYQVLFLVADSTGGGSTEAHQSVTVAEGQNLSISTVLSGPPGSGVGTLTGTMTAATGLPPGGGTTIAFTSSGGWTAPPGVVNADGSFTAILPAGTYSIVISRNSSESDSSEPESLTTSVNIAAGQVTTVSYTLPPAPPLAIPPGTSASNTARDLVYLNAERQRWGLPAGLTAAPTWSQACAAHDAYLAANKILEHPEQEGKPGYSPGGNWAGMHSVLSEGSVWSAQGNPWEDAPFHLYQLFMPDVYTLGIDESRGYTCTTTWPGVGSPTLPAGTVITYPGNGTTGLPPAEDAREWPSVPGKAVGIPEGTIAGRELFVYEEQPPAMGSCGGFCFAQGPSIASASLNGPSGPVVIKWVDSIIIPVKPLAAYTTYIATVTLNASASIVPGQPEAVPQLTHQWSFTTGAVNTSGVWPGLYGNTRSGPSDGATGRLAILHATLTHTRFRVAKKETAISAGRRTRAPLGTTVRFALSAPASVQITITRATAGVRRGRRCVEQTPRSRRSRARRCMRTVSFGTLKRANEVAGGDTVPFSGRIGRHALHPGAYHAALTALRGGVRSRPVVLPFVIVH